MLKYHIEMNNFCERTHSKNLILKAKNISIPNVTKNNYVTYINNNCKYLVFLY